MYDKLPRVRYITPSGYKEMSDITTTFRIRQKVIDEGAYPINVAVPDTDRPDVFADKVYKNPKMHWTLLNLNNLTNPYYDWVLSPQSFENYMDEKYPGYTMFLLNTGGTQAFEGSFRVNDIVWSTGVTNPALQPSVLSSLENARVVSYDPAYCRLVIEFTQKTAWVPTEGGYIAGSNVDVRGVTQYYVGKIGKFIESKFAAHHFENSDGEELNPRVPASLHNKFISESDLGFTFGATPLGRYIFEDYTTGMVINIEHEIEENDAKKNITVVGKQYISALERDLERQLNDG